MKHLIYISTLYMTFVLLNTYFPTPSRNCRQFSYSMWSSLTQYKSSDVTPSLQIQDFYRCLIGPWLKGSWAIGTGSAKQQPGWFRCILVLDSYSFFLSWDNVSLKYAFHDQLYYLCHWQHLVAGLFPNLSQPLGVQLPSLPLTSLSSFLQPLWAGSLLHHW